MEFRTKFKYSNFPFVLAGYVTEKLRGKTWEDDVTETLFKALGMGKECSLRWGLSSSIHPVL